MNYKVKKRSIYNFKEDKVIVRVDCTVKELNKNSKN